MTTDTGHAKYSPSQLPRIVLCPGSVSIHEGSPSTSYAVEGTLCHDIVADHLNKGEFTLDMAHPVYLGFPEETRAELGDAIQDCLDYTFQLITQYQKDDEPYFTLVETSVTLANFANAIDCPSLIDVYGTADLIISFPHRRLLIVVDWKFGKGVEVYPDSEQLSAYGLGALRAPNVLKNFDTIQLHIGQPRLYDGLRFKMRETTPEELFAWAKEKLAPALKECEGINPTFRPSDKACQWCSAKKASVKNRTICRARHEWAQQNAEEVFKMHAQLPYIKIDDEGLVAFLERARSLSSYISDIEAFLVNSIKAGKQVAGLKLVEGRSNRDWYDPKAFIQWADTYAPDIDPFESKVLSPAKAEKAVKRARASSEEFKALVYKPPGKPTLVKATDPRPAIVYKDASEIFQDYVEDDQ